MDEYVYARAEVSGGNGTVAFITASDYKGRDEPFAYETEDGYEILEGKRFLCMQDVFDHIIEAYEFALEQCESGAADYARISVSYDGEYGFPAKMNFWIGVNAVDYENSIGVWNWKKDAPQSCEVVHFTVK